MSKHNKHLINLLKKFPDQNPNPVIRLSKDGTLEYFNNPSKLKNKTIFAQKKLYRFGIERHGKIYSKLFQKI